MDKRMKFWHYEAVEAAKAKKNSALPNNRRVRTITPTVYGDESALWFYTRGTVTLIGYMEVELS